MHNPSSGRAGGPTTTTSMGPSVAQSHSLSHNNDSSSNANPTPAGCEARQYPPVPSTGCVDVRGNAVYRTLPFKNPAPHMERELRYSESICAPHWIEPAGPVMQRFGLPGTDAEVDEMMERFLFGDGATPTSVELHRLLRLAKREVAGELEFGPHPLTLSGFEPSFDEFDTLINNQEVDAEVAFWDQVSRWCEEEQRLGLLASGEIPPPSIDDSSLPHVQRRVATYAELRRTCHFDWDGFFNAQHRARLRRCDAQQHIPPFEEQLPALAHNNNNNFSDTQRSHAMPAMPPTPQPPCEGAFAAFHNSEVFDPAEIDYSLIVGGGGGGGVPAAPVAPAAPAPDEPPAPLVAIATENPVTPGPVARKRPRYRVPRAEHMARRKRGGNSKCGARDGVEQATSGNNDSDGTRSEGSSADAAATAAAAAAAAAAKMAEAFAKELVALEQEEFEARRRFVQSANGSFNAIRCTFRVRMDNFALRQMAKEARVVGAVLAATPAEGVRGSKSKAANSSVDEAAETASPPPPPPPPSPAAPPPFKASGSIPMDVRSAPAKAPPTSPSPKPKAKRRLHPPRGRHHKHRRDDSEDEDNALLDAAIQKNALLTAEKARRDAANEVVKSNTLPTNRVAQARFDEFTSRFGVRSDRKAAAVDAIAVFCSMSDVVNGAVMDAQCAECGTSETMQVVRELQHTRDCIAAHLNSMPLAAAQSHPNLPRARRLCDAMNDVLSKHAALCFRIAKESACNCVKAYSDEAQNVLGWVYTFHHSATTVMLSTTHTNAYGSVLTVDEKLSIKYRREAAKLFIAAAAPSWRPNSKAIASALSLRLLLRDPVPAIFQFRSAHIEVLETLKPMAVAMSNVALVCGNQYVFFKARRQFLSNLFEKDDPAEEEDDDASATLDLIMSGSHAETIATWQPFLLATFIAAQLPVPIIPADAVPWNATVLIIAAIGRLVGVATTTAAGPKQYCEAVSTHDFAAVDKALFTALVLHVSLTLFVVRATCLEPRDGYCADTAGGAGDAEDAWFLMRLLQRSTQAIRSLVAEHLFAIAPRRDSEGAELMLHLQKFDEHCADLEAAVQSVGFDPYAVAPAHALSEDDVGRLLAIAVDIKQRFEAIAAVVNPPFLRHVEEYLATVANESGDGCEAWATEFCAMPPRRETTFKAFGACRDGERVEAVRALRHLDMSEVMNLLSENKPASDAPSLSAAYAPATAQMLRVAPVIGVSNVERLRAAAAASQSTASDWD